mgnify:CR=1 FL=1
MRNTLVYIKNALIYVVIFLWKLLPDKKIGWMIIIAVLGSMYVPWYITTLSQRNTFIEQFKIENEEKKEIAKANTECFEKDIKKRFEDLEFNIQGLQEGFKPGDTGLEQRLADIEFHIEKIAIGEYCFLKIMS